MSKKEHIKEVALIAVILGDHFTEKLYTLIQQQGQGYMATADTLSDWAIEFEKKHRKTNWEKVLEKGMKPLSKEMSSIICFDDAIYDFGYYKLQKFR